MAIRKIEVPLWTNEGFDGVLDSARILAERFDAHIDVRFIRPRAADLVLSSDFAYFPSDILALVERQGLEAAGKARARFDDWRERHQGNHPALRSGGRPGIVWRDEVGPVAEVVARHGRVADLTLLRRPTDVDGSVNEAFEAALFQSGRLALLVDDIASEELFDHAMIAWNGSVEAARAVAQALPMIAAASQVSVFTVGEDKADADGPGALIEYLALHGVLAKPLAADPDAASVSAALFDAARGAGVSLLVMGAYTHSRLRQTLLGGVTRDVLRTPGIAALMGR